MYNVPKDTNSGTYNNDSVDGHLMYADLYKAVQSGNWTAAREFLESWPTAAGARITHKGNTALHIAVAAGHLGVVEELVKLMRADDLEILDYDGFSALTEAAVGGKKDMAQCMLSKNEKLISIASSVGQYLPVYTAISFGHIETARYLYSLTPPGDLMPERSYNGADLFINAISTRTLDIALDLLQRCPRLTFANNANGNSPLLALASAPHLFPSGSRLVFWKQWIYKYCIHVQSADSIINETGLNIQKEEKHQGDQVNTINSADSIINQTSLNIQKEEKHQGDQVNTLNSADSIINETRLNIQRNTIISVRTLLRHLPSNVLNFFGIEKLCEMKLIHVQSHKLLCQMCEEISNANDQQRMDSRVYDAIISAIKSGIIEFVLQMLEKNPDLVWTRDEGKRNIYSLAVLHRQAKILNQLFELHLKNALTCSLDVNSNGMLHMAGMLAESTMLNRIPGAALQMQKELQWFKEVEAIVHPKVREATNEDGLTPRELFTKTHEAMLKSGEQWIKDTARSCTVVGALIVTMMFAASFNIPGGNKQDTGLPIFLPKGSLMVFIISDALSLFSSSTSVLMFLGILTSRYAEDDFLTSLPTKMIIGLSTLLFSIATMMFTFSAALLITLRHQQWIAVQIIFWAGVLFILFIMTQFRLLVEMFISTYGPGIFGRKIKLTFN
ncbi:uncharacterized protein LOC108990128 [Juglans regia]|uniref:Uncharacterized protein LOC108990128 n=1 Tax=Juglans regia TaxID=51240 RepID=A0A6P9EAJ9_JUGRE|nr:uncharacterized protein LOC108990128 [Juglans regia]